MSLLSEHTWQSLADLGFWLLVLITNGSFKMAPKSILMVIMIKYSSLGVRFLLSGFSDFPLQCTRMDYVKSSDPEIHTGQGEKVCSWHFHIPYCDFSFSNNSVAWLEQDPCCRCPLPRPVLSKSLPRLRHSRFSSHQPSAWTACPGHHPLRALLSAREWQGQVPALKVHMVFNVLCLQYSINPRTWLMAGF